MAISFQEQSISKMQKGTLIKTREDFVEGTSRLAVMRVSRGVYLAGQSNLPYAGRKCHRGWHGAGSAVSLFRNGENFRER